MGVEKCFSRREDGLWVPRQQAKSLEDALRAVGLRPQALEQAIAAAKAINGRVTDAIREDKTLPDERVAQALALATNIPWLPTAAADDLDLASLRDLMLDEDGRFVPIHRDGEAVAVALSYPNDKRDAATALMAKGEKFRVQPCIATPRVIETLHYRYFVNTAARFDACIDVGDYSGALGALLIHACYLGGVENLYLEPGVRVGHIRFGVEGVRRHFRALPIERGEDPDLSNGTMEGSFGRLINLIVNDMRVRDVQIHAQGALNEEIPEALRGRYDFRVEVMRTVHGLKAVLRPYDRHAEAADFANLGLDPQTAERLRDYVEAPYGLVMVVGPTGSGKNTTIASLLFTTDAVSRSIQTVENPAELRVGTWAQHEIPRTAVGSEAEAQMQYEIVRGLLRSAPQVIYFGEVRDGDALSLAIKRVARTGHLTLTTFHDVSAAGTVASIREMRTIQGERIGADAFSSVLLGILSQRLVRRICRICGQPDEREETRSVLYEAGLGAGSAPRRALDAGCPHCFHTGYRGRILVYELLHVDEEMRDLITHEAPVAKLYEKMGNSLWRCGLERVAMGLTSIDELRRVVRIGVA
ncbi:type II secretion system protein E [bacterium BMS3Bbin13]|nr:type II secretion system protein E [bacterium BMS3Bbin13]